jgi:hypothetical protein
MVYRGVRGYDDFQPWLDRIVNFPETVVDDAIKSMPPEWIDGDEDHLAGLMERLLRRGKRVPDLIRDCSRGRINPFPNWR